MVPTFVAIDFETADDACDSACAVGVVRVENGAVVKRWGTLIQPPRRAMRFSRVHGLGLADFGKAPTFAAAWSTIEPLLRGAAFVAAHNARFDRAVLLASCGRAGIRPPVVPFLCTRDLACEWLGLSRAALPEVCRRLAIPLTRHHDPLCDAEAAARIVLALDLGVVPGRPGR